MHRNLNKWYRRKAEFDSVWDTLSFSTWFNLKTSEVHDCCALQKTRRFQSPTNGRRQSFSTERNQPLYSVTLLHQRSLVHGPDPAIHVLLCVRTEEICPHPAVFCLWANHRVPIVNVGAHSCMGRLSKRERERDQGGERMRGWIWELLTEDRKKLSGRLRSEKLCFLVYRDWRMTFQGGQSLRQHLTDKKRRVGSKCCSRNNVIVVSFVGHEKWNISDIFQVCFIRKQVDMNIQQKKSLLSPLSLHNCRNKQPGAMKRQLCASVTALVEIQP